MIETTEYILDPTTREMIAEMNGQIQTLAVQMNGALALVCRQQKLPGQWQLAPCGTKMLRKDVPSAPELVPDFTKKNGTRKK